jgi:general secretion pathway protein C
MNLKRSDKFKAYLEDFFRNFSNLVERLPSLNEVYSKYSKKIILVMSFLSAYFVGDLSSTFLGQYLAQKSPKQKNFDRPVQIVFEKPYLQSRASYEGFVSKNHFCPGCIIPDIKSIAAIRPKDCSKAKLIPGSGIKILGTIVLSDPRFSVVTLSEGAGDTQALKQGDRFKSYGKVFEIRRQRICFEKDDGILHAVDVPVENFKFGQPLSSVVASSTVEGMTQVGENEVHIAAQYYREKVSDISIIQQAYAEAVKDATGAIKGFKILSIAPGSIIETLGFQPEDILIGANGEPLNSPAKAQELYAAAYSTTDMTIEIERGGQRITKTFKVK